MNVFITGITGTLGTALAKLHHSRGDRIWGCARDEARIVQWMIDNPRIATIFVGCASNVADRDDDQYRCLTQCDVLYHCAAMKHVDLCESNPGEAWRSNVILVDLIAGVCKDLKVRFVLASSDKACLPQGVYGATKLVAERIALRYSGAVARLGNLVGSSGSVFLKWQDAVRLNKPIEVTNLEMTRYLILVDDAAKFVADRCQPNLVTAPNMKAIRLGTLVDRMTTNVKVVGARPGETIHQWLFAPGDVIMSEHDRFIMECGRREWPSGMRSDTAHQWDTDELLKLAGLKL